MTHTFANDSRENKAISDLVLENQHIPVIRKLYDEKNRIERFRKMDEYLPYRVIKKGGNLFKFKEKENQLDLNLAYEFHNEKRNIDEFLKRTVATGFLVIKDDEIVSEKYFHGNTKDTRHTSFSMAKSYVAALIGFAIDDGYITGVDRQVVDYVPELKGSGYDGVTIEDTLNMVTGIEYNEDYHDPKRDGVIMFDESFYRGRGHDQYAATRERKYPIGTFLYKGMDSQVLGMIVKGATGKNPSEYLEEKVWTKIGMEHDAFMNMDAQGNDITYAFLNATLRDYAKFGRLYLHNGNWEGEQILSEKWVRDSIFPTDSSPTSYNFGFLMGYKYQWWIPHNNRNGVFCTLGLWGQITYVDPNENVIIAMNSVGSSPTGTVEERIKVCETIVNHLKG